MKDRLLIGIVILLAALCEILDVVARLIHTVAARLVDRLRGK